MSVQNILVKRIAAIEQKALAAEEDFATAMMLARVHIGTNEATQMMREAEVYKYTARCLNKLCRMVRENRRGGILFEFEDANKLRRIAKAVLASDTATIHRLMPTRFGG